MKEEIKIVLRDFFERRNIYLENNLTPLTNRIMKVISDSIDKESWFFKNCKKQRRSKAKICEECPFKEFLEEK